MDAAPNSFSNRDFLAWERWSCNAARSSPDLTSESSSLRALAQRARLSFSSMTSLRSFLREVASFSQQMLALRAFL